MVAISSKLLEDGMKLNKKGDKKYLKFSMTFSNVPIHSKIFTEQKFLSEEFALKELINECPLSADNILVFDRGVQARSTFDEFNNQDFIFVTRLNNYARFETINEFKIIDNKTEQLIIEQDLEIKLFDKRNKKNRIVFTINYCHRKESNKNFIFFKQINSLTSK